MPESAESGLLVVRLPLRTASEQIQEKLSLLELKPQLPSTASDVFSLANLSNLSRERFDPSAKDSAVTFLRALAPPSPTSVELTMTDTVLPPTDLLFREPRHLRPWHVLLGLALSALSFVVTLLLFGLPEQTEQTPPPPVAVRPLPRVDRPIPSSNVSPLAPEEPALAPELLPAALDRQQLRRTMDRLRFRVKRCFTRRHRRGRAQVRVTVRASGEPESVHVTSRAGRSVVACIRRQVRQTWFPPVGAPSMSVARTYHAR